MKLQATPTLKPTPMTTTTLGSQKTMMMPCAACKLLRRKCVMECPFAPYFHPSEPHRFAVVHKVFGASNVSKMLMEVPENHRVDVANSLVYEANARLRDPVYGCLGIISSLQHQTQALQAELHEVRTQVMRYRFLESELTTTTSANHHLMNTQNIGTNLINNDNNTNIINNIFLNTSISTTHIVPSYSLTNSSQSTTNSSDPYHTSGSSKSTMHHPNINHSKEHYWSQLHQSCR